jgi:hypothetical protein
MARRAGTNRSFGLLFAGVCAILAILAYRAHRHSDVGWALAAVVFVAVALTVPRLLAPLRRGWMRLGTLLSRVVNPIVLGLAYAIVFVPVAAIMRLFGRDTMARRREPACASYWIESDHDPRGVDRLKEQF